MIKIRVPASSANVGSGFDTFGIAFQLYNVFGFENSEEFTLEGFPPEFTMDRNLVFSSYVRVFEVLKQKVIPVKIVLIESKIPMTRGLGSSSTCVVAGVLAANYFLGSPLTKADCLSIMASIEGHPDNVSPALYGSFCAALMRKNEVMVTKTLPSANLYFWALIPNFHQSTEIARLALPKVLPFEDIIYSLSRAAQLPKAIESGNIKWILECVKDKIHEPFRYPLIESGELIRDAILNLGGVVTISGSGPALLVISDDPNFADQLANLHFLFEWQIEKLTVESVGSVLTE